MLTANARAFLDMIATSEIGKQLLQLSDNGYNVLFGATASNLILFHSYADHPRIRTYEKHDEFIKNGKVDFTTAAGRYQITQSNYDHYKISLGLSDFGHDSQDAIAMQLIKEAHALDNVNAGNFNIAVAQCCKTWASLPGAGYGQHENKLEALREAYTEAGGNLAFS
jgi:muramidase (phage lysozyme)